MYRRRPTRCLHGAELASIPALTGNRQVAGWSESVIKNRALMLLAEMNPTFGILAMTDPNEAVGIPSLASPGCGRHISATFHHYREQHHRYFTKGWKDDLQEADDEDVPGWDGLRGHTLRGDGRRLHGRQRTRRRPRF